jgi:hypothetical protein
MYRYYPEVDVSVLMHRTITNLQQNGDDELLFTMDNGDRYIMYHSQDCCEHVRIEDIDGDLYDLVGSPVLQAEVVSGETRDGWEEVEYQNDSYTWTFYKFATIKGSVTLRWLGESNGYYSERVDFGKVEDDE